MCVSHMLSSLVIVMCIIIVKITLGHTKSNGQYYYTVCDMITLDIDSILNLQLDSLLIPLKARSDTEMERYLTAETFHWKTFFYPTQLPLYWYSVE